MSSADQEYTFFYRGIFSQFARSNFVIDGQTYRCAEQYMMAEKARTFGDDETLAKILKAKVPADIKALGREVRGFTDAKWDQVKYDAVLRGNRAKFTQNAELSRALTSTTGVLVEASPYDRIWGIGYSEDTAMTNRSKWGQNLLGLALTQVRDEIQQSQAQK